MSFEFAWPWVLLLLAPLAVGAVLLRRRGEDAATLRHPRTALLETAGGGVRARLSRALPWLGVLALALMIVASARPRTASTSREVVGEGVDLVVALDISGSMLAQDFQPADRLRVAKRIIRDFVTGRPDDRIGLVVFASRAFTQCPLTLDRSILTGFLDEIEVGLIEDGTAIGLGLGTALNRLKHSQAQSRCVVLLTDGSNNVPTLEPADAAELGKALGIRVYTIGVGKRGKVPFPQQTPFGTRMVQVEMPIDEALLQEIADVTGGRYWRAEDAAALEEIFAAIDALETSRYETTVSVWYEEKMAWFAVPALALLLLEALLCAVWLRRLP